MRPAFERFRRDIIGVLSIGIVLFLALALISFDPMDPSFNSIGNSLKANNYCGYVGSFLADALYQLFGLSAWILILGGIRLALMSFRGHNVKLVDFKFLWGFLLLISISSIMAAYFPDKKMFLDQIKVGGIVGVAVTKLLVLAFNPIGMQVFLWSSFVILLIFYSDKNMKELTEAPQRYFTLLLEQAKKYKKIKIPTPTPLVVETENLTMPSGQFLLLKNEPPQEIEEATLPRRKVTLKTKTPQRVENWQLPKISLLEDPPSSRIRVDEKEIKRKAELLKDKLAQFSVTGEVVAARPGPAVTMFEFKPDANVKLSKITELADDLALALSSESLRIIAPIPGRDVVGIETSNAQREVVYLKDQLADEQFWREEIKLPIALGKQANGDSRVIDLRKMPHLMVAGTTGSGKSVFIVSTLIGLIYKHSPKTLRLILVDPKQVDLAAFEKIPHLLMPTVTDTKQAVNSLRWAVREMEKRYKSMSKFGSRGLESFNEAVSSLTKEQIEEHEKNNQELETTPGRKMDQYYFTPQPYIVVVIEEFGDLMAVDKSNVEISVVRLAQKARACGMHLILAMQSPRKEVVTGLIKTNIPGRISFKVSSSMDSRIILDDAGAERLLAQGDMLFKGPGSSNLVRHHGPLLKDSEVFEVAHFWSKQAEPQYDASALKALDGPSFASEESEFTEESTDSDSYDDRYDEILSWASTMKEISASLIQRRFQIGYPRAARIVETFEREGVVGPANGSKPRQVLINNLANLD